jgi:hypothetical protein
MTMRFFISWIRAILSLLLVMQYVRSVLSCRSVTMSLCARSLFSISSPVLTLKSATLPDSCPVMMMLGMSVKAQTVALLPMGLKKNSGSSDSVGENFSEVSKKSVQEHTIRPVALSVDVEHPDGALISHSLFCYAHHLGVIVVERDPFDRRRELPCIQAFAGLDTPQPERIICCARDEES